MNHYEIVLLFHPDQSEQVPDMLERYKKIVTDSGGRLHRMEDWGRRQLAYPINDVHKAHYTVLNVECSVPIMEGLVTTFKFNDAVLRNMILKRYGPITETSPIKAAESRYERDRSESDVDKNQSSHSGGDIENESSHSGGDIETELEVMVEENYEKTKDKNNDSELDIDDKG